MRVVERRFRIKRMATAPGATEPMRPGANTVWRGHQPATRTALLKLLERAAGGGGDVSTADRVLVTVCEFWAAAANRDLKLYLQGDAEAVLPVARIAFATIGAADVAGLLSFAIERLRRARFDDQVEEAVERLQADLLGPGVKIDESIEAFAIRLSES